MTASSLRPTAAERLEAIWSDTPGIVGFFTSVNHKRVGRRYLVTSLTFLFLGGVQAMLMRYQLAGPNREVMSPEVYNQLMTMHGTTMIFLFNTTIWAGFGNYFVPLQIGSRDMAFPRLNMLSYWIFLLSGIFVYSSFLVGEIPEGGWFAYTPLTEQTYLQGLGMDFWAVGLAFLGVSTTVGGINFIVTILKLRAPGMSISRLPVFVWSILVMSFMIVFALPGVTLAQVLLELDRMLNFNFFLASGGGDPVLYQHLFWFWGHPEVYIVFVPATGFVSMAVASLSRTRLAGYLLVVTALVAIGFISFGVWVHHMFTVGIGFLALAFFSAASFIVAIPSGVQFYAWIATLWKGRPRFNTAMHWVLGTMFIFLFGGVTGVMVAMIAFDRQAQDSYFVVAHFHYTLVGGSVFPMMGALYYWLPKITGRMLNEAVGRISFWMAFLAFNATFGPMHVLGLWGMPRRFYTYLAEPGWGPLNLFVSVAALALFIGFALTFVNILVSLRWGKKAPPNPWDADSLEWATTSPPASFNFLEQPLIASRYPLWDQPLHTIGAEDEPRHGFPPLLPPRGVEEHYTIGTGGVDAEPEAILPMPSPSAWPFVVALGMMIALYGVLIRQFWLGMGGVFLIAIALFGWFWPTWEDEEVELARSHPDDATGRRELERVSSSE